MGGATVRNRGWHAGLDCTTLWLHHLGSLHLPAIAEELAAVSSGLFVTTKLKPAIGGVEEHAHQVTKHLNELGERITVLTPSRPRYTDVDKAFDESCGYPVVRSDTRVGSGQWLTPFFYRRGLLEIIGAARRVNADYIIASTVGSTLEVSALLASRLTKRPLITVTHEPHRSTVPWRAVFDLVLRKASRNVCVSSYTASWVAACGVDPRKISVIPNGVDLREIDSRRARAGSSPPVDAAFRGPGPVVLTVARLRLSKGIQRVIGAMPRIVSEAPGTRYVIVGDGPDGEHLVRLAAASPVADAITFLGALSDDAKFDCYSRCDVFALSSEREGFGIAYLEANAFGKPVVGGRVGGVPDAVVHGTTGLLVDPRSESEIAEAIIRLLKNPDEARRLGDNGRRRVESELTWKESAKKLLPVIRGVLESP